MPRSGCRKTTVLWPGFFAGGLTDDIFGRGCYSLGRKRVVGVMPLGEVTRHEDSFIVIVLS
jgi:hypothetical protein